MGRRRGCRIHLSHRPAARTPAQITEAGRSIEEADKNYAAYRAYVEGRGPWAPLALPPGSKSVHCKGYASDTDAYKDPHEDAVWEDNGWIQTARYDDPPDEDEPWHREYFRDRDNHRNDPAPTTTESPEEDDEMNKDKYCWLRRADGVIVNVIYNTGSGYYQPWESNNGEYNTRKARGARPRGGRRSRSRRPTSTQSPRPVRTFAGVGHERYAGAAARRHDRSPLAHPPTLDLQRVYRGHPPLGIYLKLIPRRGRPRSSSR